MMKNLSVPLHLRNSPTKLMKDLGYGKNYLYSHDYENDFVKQQYLPDKIKNMVFYKPGENDHENKLRQWLKKLWKNRF
jgi:putative ATPase